MRIGAGVIKIKNFDINGNSNRMFELIRKASSLGIDFIFFGEAVINGFDGLVWDYKIDWNKNAININSSIIKEFRKLCKSLNIGTGFGYYEKDDAGIYDSYIVINKNGEIIVNYKRINKGWLELKADTNVYKCGDELKEFNLFNIPAIITICGDLWDDEICKKVKESKAKFLLWPMYVDYTVEKWEQSEKDAYFERIKKVEKLGLIINSIVDKPDYACGGAFFVSKKGKLLKSLDFNKEGIIFYDI